MWHVDYKWKISGCQADQRCPGKDETGNILKAILYTVMGNDRKLNCFFKN